MALTSDWRELTAARTVDDLEGERQRRRDWSRARSTNRAGSLSSDDPSLDPRTMYAGYVHIKTAIARDKTGRKSRGAARGWTSTKGFPASETAWRSTGMGLEESKEGPEGISGLPIPSSTESHRALSPELKPS
ncbi:MAG: hypothetical protein M1815_004765 [Lichina confinis]|nr:MAG: hypothetical protein M1815_004765 [Lichina confinis]